MDVTKFEFEGRKVRIVTGEDGSPWWITKDVCDALEISQYRKAISRLDDDEKEHLCIKLHGWSQARTVSTVNESGLYSLIFRSNKKEAKKFKRWVTHEVLPSIRRTGAYVVPTAVPDPIARMVDPDVLKPNQRIKVVDIAWRLAQMDEAGRERVYENYVQICNLVGMKAMDADEVMDFGKELSLFIRERCVIDDNATVKARDLYGEYKRWWALKGLTGRLMSQKRFGGRLRGRFSAYKSGVYFYEGIRLRKSGE